MDLLLKKNVEKNLEVITYVSKMTSLRMNEKLMWNEEKFWSKI